MKLALIGYGKMGSLVEELAPARDFEVVDRFTGSRPLRADEVTRRRLRGVRVAVDFSVPEAVPDTVEVAADLGLHLAIGTTGWGHRREDLRQRVEAAGIGVVHAANFSLGVHLFYRLVEHAARLFATFDAYDPYLRESHHKHKRDSPSGTALELRRRLGEHYPVQLPVACLRAGHIPGSHEVGFDSEADSVVLEHRARSRQGFAAGALLAARWIAGRRGFFDFQDVLRDVHPET